VGFLIGAEFLEAGQIQDEVPGGKGRIIRRKRGEGGGWGEDGIGHDPGSSGRELQVVRLLEASREKH